MTAATDARPANEVTDRQRSGPPACRRAPALFNLSLGRKVALIPALTLLLMGMMLTVAMRMGERNTGALRVLDRDVFEPLNRAQTLKDEITLLHTRLFALLSIGNNETNPVGSESQRGRADRAGRHRSGELQPFPRREPRGFSRRSRPVARGVQGLRRPGARNRQLRCVRRELRRPGRRHHGRQVRASARRPRYPCSVAGPASRGRW